MKDTKPDRDGERERTGWDDLLYPLFEALRREKLPLGVSEYLTAVHCLRRGIGLEDPQTLLETLSLLWAGSREDRTVLEDRFRALVLPLFRTKPFPGRKKDAGSSGMSESRKKQAPDDKDISITHIVTKKGPAENENICWDRSVFLPRTGGMDFRLVPELPMAGREMTQILRKLRRMRRTGPAGEFDVDQTVDRICECGIFTGPVFQPARKNCASLLVLMDVSGSMEPFSLFMDRLVESIGKGGMFGRVDTSYFRNCPDSLVYEDPIRSRPRPLSQVLRDLERGAGILVVSDAGAACGYFSKKRCSATDRFAESLMEQVRRKDCRFAWLNPVPKVRWRNTSAEEISGILRKRMGGMFPITRPGLVAAVDMLRGIHTGRRGDGRF